MVTVALRPLWRAPDVLDAHPAVHRRRAAANPPRCKQRWLTNEMKPQRVAVDSKWRAADSKSQELKTDWMVSPLWLGRKSPLINLLATAIQKGKPKADVTISVVELSSYFLILGGSKKSDKKQELWHVELSMTAQKNTSRWSIIQTIYLEQWGGLVNWSILHLYIHELSLTNKIRGLGLGFFFHSRLLRLFGPCPIDEPDRLCSIFLGD